MARSKECSLMSEASARMSETCETRIVMLSVEIAVTRSEMEVNLAFTNERLELSRSPESNEMRYRCS